MCVCWCVRVWLLNTTRNYTWTKKQKSLHRLRHDILVFRWITTVVMACLFSLVFVVHDKQVKVRSRNKLRSPTLVMVVPMLAHCGHMLALVPDRRFHTTTTGTPPDQATWQLRNPTPCVINSYTVTVEVQVLREAAASVIPVPRSYLQLLLHMDNEFDFCPAL